MMTHAAAFALVAVLVHMRGHRAGVGMWNTRPEHRRSPNGDGSRADAERRPASAGCGVEHGRRHELQRRPAHGEPGARGPSASRRTHAPRVVHGRHLSAPYLIAGVDQNTLLWGYRNQAGELAGFDIDMVDQVAAAIFGATWSHHIHYVIVPNADRASAVYNGDVDIVAETMTITCGRQGFGSGAIATRWTSRRSTTTPGRRSWLRAGRPSGQRRISPARRVCAASGSTSLNNLAALPTPPKLMAVTNQTDCLVMLQQGQVDAISTDDTILQGLAAQDPNVRILPGVRLSDEPYGMAISKSHPEFTRFVNGVLAQERSDGTWASDLDPLAGPDRQDPRPGAPGRPLPRLTPMTTPKVTQVEVDRALAMAQDRLAQLGPALLELDDDRRRRAPRRRRCRRERGVMGEQQRPDVGVVGVLPGSVGGVGGVGRDAQRSENPGPATSRQSGQTCRRPSVTISPDVVSLAHRLPA